MKYPNFLNVSDNIGVVAPSFGITSVIYEAKYNSAKKAFEELGYSIIPSSQVFSKHLGASASPKSRAKDFVDFYKNSKIDFLMAFSGGELEYEILPYLNFKKLAKYPPKYFMGFSDNTFLSFMLTTVSDVASIYGPNFNSFGMQPWHKQNNVALKLVRGKKFDQDNFERYVDVSKEHDENPLATLHPTRKVVWKSLRKSTHLELSGRIIGGCMDCLQYIVGSKFDNFKEFKHKYSKDGVILFLEACDLNVFGIARTLQLFKLNGWLENLNGIVIGRALKPQTIEGLSLKQVYKKYLGDLNIPVLYDLDIGHVAPMLTIINGSVVQITLDGHDGNINTMFY
ncbi:MAG: LD-carboxypeptidase [Bacillales bacterium]|jgi:muramoyltetrapeptide carboxypeptidase LdcA involved in peptidoglycan recycling|nr:LD-carboxypeptidase [Bacillales bacterium]